LLAAYLTAGMFHFFSNKNLTFKCESKKLASQYSIYIIVTLSSLLLSMGVISFFIKGLHLEKMTARMITTAIMLVPNYLLHKNITFNKNIFAKTAS